MKLNTYRYRGKKIAKQKIDLSVINTSQLTSRMESQIQCPVCTLFLHVGMNLQDHLDTHPKEKVISALVNLMLVQQRANDEDPSNFQCSRYEPLTDDIQTIPPEQKDPASIQSQKATQLKYYSAVKPPPPPPPPTAAHPLMILNRSSIGCENMPRQKVPPIIPSIPMSTGTFHLITTKSSQNIPPPPPYDASVLESLSHRLAYQRNQTQTTTSTSAAASSENASSNTLQGGNDNNQELPLVRNRTDGTATSFLSTKYHLQKGDSNKGQNESECNESAHSEKSQTMISRTIRLNETDVDYELDEIDSGTNSENYASENVVNDESMSVIHVNSHIKQEKSLAQQRTNSDRPAERLKFGLKVLSNVKIPPNTVLNVSTLNTQFSEAISSKNMIIIGSSSSSSSNSSSGAIVNGKSKTELTQTERKRTNSTKKIDESRNESSVETTVSIRIFFFYLILFLLIFFFICTLKLISLIEFFFIFR